MKRWAILSLCKGGRARLWLFWALAPNSVITESQPVCHDTPTGSSYVSGQPALYMHDRADSKAIPTSSDINWRGKVFNCCLVIVWDMITWSQVWRDTQKAEAGYLWVTGHQELHSIPGQPRLCNTILLHKQTNEKWKLYFCPCCQFWNSSQLHMNLNSQIVLVP